MEAHYIINNNMLTNRKKSTNNTNVSPETFETIFQQSPVSTQILSPDGYTIMVNKAWEKLWGFSASQIGDYNMLKDPQLIERGIMPYIKRGFKGEVVDIPPVRYEPEKTVKIKGSVPYRWVKAIMYPVKDEKGKVKKIVLQHEDITIQKDAEESIIYNEQTLRLGLNAGKIGIWDWNINTGYISWSDRIYQMHGIKKGSFNGTYEQYLKLIHPEDQDKINSLVQQALHNDKPYQLELRAVLPNGEVRWLAASAQVFRDQLGKPTRMLGAVYDITERKDIEKQKDEFMAIVSHELKTPITSIKAYTQVLEHKFIKAGDQSSALHLSKMDTQINKLTTLISDLLDVTKIEAGKLKMQYEEFEFRELVEEIVEETQRTTEHHDIIIEGKINSKVYGDCERIGQVLTNFLTNAIKYTPNSSKKKEKIIVSISKNKNEIICKVQDHGVGIAKEKQKLVFNRYYRETGSKEMTFPGLGLGLYIAAEIIQRHKGKIGVESKKGKGSTFFFSLPMSEN
jgi:PAS domain S-box-containing protein